MSGIVIASTLGRSLVKTAAKSFGAAVIERWTRHRAEQFFEAFIESCGIDLSADAVRSNSEVLLDKILADEKKSEVLFDAYRRICFAKSRDLGPRVVGLLTGKLVFENRMANGMEEEVFAAAELLSDGDFLDFMKEYHKHRSKAEGVSDMQAEHYMLGEAVYVRWLLEGGRGIRSSEMDIGPFPWDEAFGRWAVELSQCGLMSARIQQHMEEDESAYSQGAATITTVKTTISFSRGCKVLYDLVARGLRAK